MHGFGSGSSRDISALDPGAPSSLPTDPDTKVDISALKWEDKERVLRILFAKINNAQVGLPQTVNAVTTDLQQQQQQRSFCFTKFIKNLSIYLRRRDNSFPNIPSRTPYRFRK